MKTKAIFMIYLIIALSFAIYQTPDVKAQQTACCQYTIDGETCVYTDAERCNQGLQSYTSCDNTDYCKLGTCIDQEAGICSVNVGKSTCIQQGGIWDPKNINDIAQCQPGCCRLGTECVFTTQQRCVREASAFPGLQPQFDESIATEQACINSCKSLEKGACVQQDKSCKLTTRSLCQDGTFHANLLCSNPTLGTLCAPQQYKQCQKEDVFWFDSCNNPENPYHSNKQLSYNNGIIIPENKVDGIYGIAKSNDENNGNCDYPQENICSEASGEAKCASIHCSNTISYENLDYTGGTKQAGESWCLYESAIGFGYDLVGSRHFRASCVNGEELIEPCKDYREEFCIQNKDIDGKLLQKQQFLSLGTDYSEAMCRPNRFDECAKVNDPTLKCGGECNKYSGLQRQACCMRKACDDIQKRDCYWQEGQNEWGGMCVPLVSQGLKFWDASASEDVCSKANQECKVYFYSKAISGKIGKSEREWEIVGNKVCTTKDWTLAGNTICKSTGDCGAWYNIEGKLSTEGYSSKDIKIGDKDYSYDITSSDIDSFALAKNPKGKNYEKWKTFGQRTLAYLGTVVAGASIYGMVTGSWSAFGYMISPVYGTLLEGIGEGTIRGTIQTSLAQTYAKTATTTMEKFTTEHISGSTLTKKGTQSLVTKGFDEAAVKAADLATRKSLEKTSQAALQTALESEAQKAAQKVVQEALKKGIYESQVPAVAATAEAAKQEVLKTGLTEAAKQEVLSKSITEEAYKEALAKQIGEQTASEATTSTLSAVLSVVNFVMWAYTIYQLADILGAQNQKQTFETYCNPWQAPDGGKDCEKCNDFLGGCSEYRCRSLGKSCQLINEGTEQETCVSISQYDTKAPIILKPTKGLGYIIQEKIKPFTPVELYIETDEPAHCKFSAEPNVKFEQMQFDFGSPSYLYNHTLIFSLPSNVTQPEVLQITNGGQYTLYTKCKDSNGNSNTRDYYYKFEIDKSPDMTPPKVEFVSIPTNSYIAHDLSEVAISALVSEPSQCKWSKLNRNYEQMENEFACVQNPFDYTSVYYGLYECTTLLDITDNINNYFFKCKDNSGRSNTMTQSYKYTLKSTTPLEILSVKPTGTSSQESPTLEVETAKGAEEGLATCGYSETPNLPIQEIAVFQITNSTHHEQLLLGLQARAYTYYVTCVDIAGNQETKQTTFEVTVDKQPPKITQIYIDQNTNTLHIITIEEAKCEYAHTPFSFESGISMTGTIDHEASIDAQQRTYYIKCQDRHENIMSATIYP